MEFNNETITTLMETVIPFNKFMGIRITSVRNGFARMELPFREEFIGDPVRPALHGGVITTLIDTCGGAAVWSAADPGDRVSTVDLRVDYLLPGPLEDLACEGKVLRIGNRVGVADMRVFSIKSPDRIIASGKGVYNVRRSE